MSMNQGRAAAGKRKNNYGTSTYIAGNTVRKLKPQDTVVEKPKRKLSHAARKNREKAVHMNFGYVLFLSAALVISGMILLSYIRLQWEITNSISNISRLESELNQKKLDNDEEYNRVLASVDLEEIKRIAMDELGMTYASEGQVVIVSGEEDDYVKQYEDLPAHK